MDAAFLAELADRAGLGAASIAIRSLGRPEEAGALAVDLDAERTLSPASMIKLPIAMALEYARRDGRRRLTDTTVVAATNLTANDVPSPFVAGYRASLGELGRAMLSESDNVATNVLIDVLGRAMIDASCRHFGLKNTAVRRKLSGALPLIDDPEACGRNAHPAADAAALLEYLAAQAERGEPHWVYEALAAQRWNEKLSRGFSAGDLFAHKTGDTDEVSHDGGILKLPDGSRFVIVVYTALPSSPSTDARFAAFAQALRPHLR